MLDDRCVRSVEGVEFLGYERAGFAPIRRKVLDEVSRFFGGTCLIVEGALDIKNTHIVHFCWRIFAKMSDVSYGLGRENYS